MLQFPRLIVVVVIFYVILIQIPDSSCLDDAQYTNCSTSYSCGSLEITYPFWGGFWNRPEYCGYPGFQVTCLNGILKIDISSLTYRILSVDNSTQSLTVARDDYWDGYCPTYLRNVTLDYDIFSYGLNYQNLNLYYGCPTGYGGPANQYTCTINGTSSTGYYLTRDQVSEIGNGSAITDCNASVMMPVLETYISNLTTNSSVNDLQRAIEGGFGLVWQANNSLCDRCVLSGGQCGYAAATGGFVCYCLDKPYSSKCGLTFGSGKAPNNRLALALGLTIPVAVISFVSIMICCLLKKSTSKLRRVFVRKNGQDRDLEEFIKNYGSLSPKQFNYSDVKRMTNYLRDKLGEGGYGCVYKGKLSDGRLVAVKILNKSKGNGEEFLNEVASISRTSHVNVVSLLGFCYNGTKRALIYEFMPNGSLDKYISNVPPSLNTSCGQLERTTLSKIAIGIARGLDYLHSGCNTRILHLDIKPHNILLDLDMCPKISDFGLAKLGKRKESIISMVGARGTIGYIAPEVFSRAFGNVSYKSDVYSYGMMILEMAGVGITIEDEELTETSEMYFPNYIYRKIEAEPEGMALREIDEAACKDEEIERKMILVGLWCIQTNPVDRPSMAKVVEMLEGSIELLQIPPKPILSSSTPRASPLQYTSSNVSSLSQIIDPKS